MRLFQALRPRARLARALFATLLTSALFMFPAIGPRATEAAGTVVATQNISGTTNNSEAPQITAGGGRIAATWAERASTSTGSFGFNSTPIDSAFGGASITSTGADSRYQWADVALDSSGTAHIIYSAGSGVSYQRRTTSGGKSTISVGSANFPNGSKIARAPNGTLWALWRDTNGGLFYKYSTNNGDNWTNGGGGSISNGSGTALTIDIAVDQNNTPHVVWYNNNGTNKGQIRYADWNGSSFDTSDLTTDSFYDADPAITIDGSNTTHVVWRKQLSGPPNEKWGVYHASRPAGGSFGNFEAVSTISGNPGFAPAVGSDSSNNLYITYSELLASNSRHVLLMNRLSGQSWDGPQDLKVAGRRFDSRSAVTGTTTSGPEAHVLIQSDLGTDDAEIYYKRISFGPAGPTAQPSIENGAASTKNNPVSVTFTATGSPAQVRWRWGAAPTDAANDSGGWQTYASPLSVALPAGASSCSSLTLYTQTRNSSQVEGPVANDAILFDNTVSASVKITNPYLAGLPQTFARSADAYTKATDGAFDGDPSYTRIPQFFLSIADAGECSSLASFSVPASNFNGNITGGSYQNKVTLPQAANITPGSTQTIGVTVLDTLGNIGNYSNALVYDPANTDTTGTQTNTLGLPVLAQGGSIAANNANSIIRTLTFNGISVTDNVYGQKEGLTAGKQFWGVWIANSRTNVGPTDASLKWYPIQVKSPGSTFSVPWSLFTGLNLGADRNQTGTYYVYVRFLDGAGNATVDALQTSVTLTTGYTIPTVDMPVIKR